MNPKNCALYFKLQNWLFSLISFAQSLEKIRSIATNCMYIHIFSKRMRMLRQRCHLKSKLKCHFFIIFEQSLNVWVFDGHAAFGIFLAISKKLIFSSTNIHTVCVRICARWCLCLRRTIYFCTQSIQRNSQGSVASNGTICSHT